MPNAKSLLTGTFAVCPKFDFLIEESLEVVANAAILMAKNSNLCSG